MEKAQIKIYAAFAPATEKAYAAVKQEQQQAIGLHDNEVWLFLEGDQLRIAFEGYYFPVEEVLQALERTLPAGSGGKLDELRMDTWELCRHTLENGIFTSATRSLNHVLAYSGH